MSAKNKKMYELKILTTNDKNTPRKNAITKCSRNSKQNLLQQCNLDIFTLCEVRHILPGIKLCTVKRKYLTNKLAENLLKSFFICYSHIYLRNIYQ